MYTLDITFKESIFKAVLSVHFELTAAWIRAAEVLRRDFMEVFSPTWTYLKAHANVSMSKRVCRCELFHAMTPWKRLQNSQLAPDTLI